MRCKAFPSTLSDAVQQLFSSLPPCSVGSFADLTDKFLNHFTASRAHRKTTRSLYGLTQGESESLKDFIGRFNCEIAQILNLNQEVALYAFTRALKPSSFAKSLDISFQAHWMNLELEQQGTLELKKVPRIEKG